MATDTTKVAGGRTGIPFGVSGNLLLRRTDVLKEAGLDAPPATWAPAPVAPQPPAYVQRPDPGLESYAGTFLDGLDSIPTYRPTVGCIIPAYNEAETIAGVLDSLLQQTRLPDVIHLVVNNTSDESV
jgi:hypothetical protein